MGEAYTDRRQTAVPTSADGERMLEPTESDTGLPATPGRKPPLAWPTAARIGLWLLVGFGWALLAWNFSKPITLHGDEVSVLTNIVGAGFTELAEPLERRQVAPFGFLLVVWSLIGWFGLGVVTVKSVALAAALLSVPLFAALVRRVCEPFPGLVVMFGFVASGEWLLQACRVKPYTLDVLFALLGLSAGLWVLNRRCGWREAVVLALLAAVGVWFSLPFYLVLAAVGGVLLVTRLVEGRRGELGYLVLPAAVGVASGVAHYLWVLRGQRGVGDTGDYMVDYWGAGFMPPPWSEPGGVAGVLAKGVGDATGLALPGLVLGLVVLGAVQMLYRNDRRAWLLLAPLGAAVLASAAQVYPLVDRLALYLAPFVLLLVAAGLDGLRRVVPGPSGRPGLALMMLASAVLVSDSVERRGVASFNDDVVPVLRHVHGRLEPGQHVYLFYGVQSPYHFYTEHLDPTLAFDESQLTLGGRHRDDPTRYDDEVQGLRQHREVWVVLSHATPQGGVDEGPYLRLLLDRYGERVAEYRGWGAVAILWRSDPADAPDADAGTAPRQHQPTPGDPS